MKATAGRPREAFAAAARALPLLLPPLLPQAVIGVVEVPWTLPAS